MQVPLRAAIPCENRLVLETSRALAELVAPIDCMRAVYPAMTNEGRFRPSKGCRQPTRADYLPFLANQSAFLPASASCTK